MNEPREPRQHYKVIEVIDDPGVLSAVAAHGRGLNAYGAHVVILAAVGGDGHKIRPDDMVVEVQGNEL